MSKDLREFLLFCVGVLANCSSVNVWLDIASALMICLTEDFENSLTKTSKRILTAAIKHEAELDHTNDDIAFEDFDENEYELKEGKMKDISVFPMALENNLKAKRLAADLKMDPLIKDKNENGF